MLAHSIFTSSSLVCTKVPTCSCCKPVRALWRGRRGTLGSQPQRSDSGYAACQWCHAAIPPGTSCEFFRQYGTQAGHVEQRLGDVAGFIHVRGTHHGEVTGCDDKHPTEVVFDSGGDHVARLLTRASPGFGLCIFPAPALVRLSDSEAASFANCPVLFTFFAKTQCANVPSPGIGFDIEAAEYRRRALRGDVGLAASTRPGYIGRVGESGPFSTSVLDIIGVASFPD